MAHLQVKNVPDSLHERLRRFARETDRTLSAAVLAAVEREVASWEWRRRLALRAETDLGVDAATLLAEARALQNGLTIAGAVRALPGSRGRGG
ncbi:MAG: toxin-antitoxin system HicB family antitoxin [Acidobacteria bacterium]|nr:toxin-antitoxin system HicB family antitoxin [Acidobacteriota bacterium]